MKEKVLKLFTKIGDDKVSEYTAQCSYYMILAFVPFLILLITLIQYTSIKPEDIYNLISTFIPNNMKDLILGVVQEVYSKSIGTISISIIFTFWSAGKGFYALKKGLDAVYEKDKGKYLYLRAKSIIYTIIFLILISIALVLLIFGHGILNIMQERFLMFNSIFWNIISEIVFLGFTFIMYLAIYKFIPKHKVTFVSQIPGAIIGAIGLNLVSFFFSKYLIVFKGFSIMYGSLTTIILIMLWTYACIYTLFIGAEINKIFKYNKRKNLNV